MNDKHMRDWEKKRINHLHNMDWEIKLTAMEMAHKGMTHIRGMLHHIHKLEDRYFWYNVYDLALKYHSIDQKRLKQEKGE